MAKLSLTPAKVEIPRQMFLKVSPLTKLTAKKRDFALIQETAHLYGGCVKSVN
jgi:hypothetical protein